MTDYQDKVARKRANPAQKLDITSGLETAASGLLTINTKLKTLRAITITPVYATATDVVTVQITDYATPSAVTATVSDDAGGTEAASIECFWIATGYID